MVGFSPLHPLSVRGFREASGKKDFPKPPFSVPSVLSVPSVSSVPSVLSPQYPRPPKNQWRPLKEPLYPLLQMLKALLDGFFALGEEGLDAVGKLADEEKASFVGKRESRLKSGEGANDDSIGTAVGDVAIGNKHHEEGRRRKFGGVEFGCKGRERAHPFFNEGSTTQLDFDETESPIAEVYDGIAFKSALVAVVPNGAVKSIGIGAQIADGQSLEKQPKRGEIPKEVGGSETQSCGSDGGVAKMASVRGAHGGFGAKIWTPGGEVLDDKQLAKSGKIVQDGVLGEGIGLVGGNVVADDGGGGLGALQSGEATEKASRRVGIAGDSVNAGHVGGNDGIEVVWGVGQGATAGHLHCGGPASPAEGERNAVEVGARRCPGGVRPGKEVGQGNGSG